jgi:hypothetical protein
MGKIFRIVSSLFSVVSIIGLLALMVWLIASGHIMAAIVSLLLAGAFGYYLYYDCKILFGEKL